MFVKKYVADRQFYRRLFLVISPIILQFFIQNFINFLDNFMVGRLGEEAISAISVANKYYMLFYAAIVSTCTAASIFTAQFFGSNQKEKLAQMFGIKIIFSLIITLSFMVLGLLKTDGIISIFIDENLTAQGLGVSYLKIALFSYLPLAISTAFTFTFRPIGKTTLPMVASSIGMVVNFLFNLLLINGLGPFPKLGVEGAAIATVIARFMELFVYVIIYFTKDYIFKAPIKTYFKIDFSLAIRTIVKIIPLFINEMAFNFAMLTIFWVYSERGIGAISAIEIADVGQEQPPRSLLVISWDQMSLKRQNGMRTISLDTPSLWGA